MKILITGGKGQLGTDLTLFLKDKGFQVYSFSSSEMDISNLDLSYKITKEIMPDVIINCAAYTAVDECEKNINKAFLINTIGAKNISIISNEINAKLFHISTDYVFNGEKDSPYTEYDKPDPISIYGKSKYYGEVLVKEHNERFFILRVSGVYGKYGKNFIKTIINLAREKDELKVVNDQFVTPTSTIEICKQIHILLPTTYFGLYHATCEGSCTWYEFTKYIFKNLNIKTKVIPCSTEEFPRPAKRPKNSVLENFNLKLIGFNAFSQWQEAVKIFLKSF